MSGCDERLELGAYVLGELDDDERGRLDAHLGACPPCRRELAELEDAPALLALAADPAPRPPERVRDRVLASAVARRVRRRWAGVAVAAGLVAALLGGGTVALVVASTPPTVAVGLTPVEPFDSGGSALLEETPAGVSVRVDLRDLSPLAPGEVYEAWLSTHDDALVSLGHLRPDGAGAVTATLRARGSLGDYRSFWITAEPALSGGTHDGPTVVYARLPSLEW